MTRVIQWATGGTGGEILKSLLVDPRFDVAGVLVYSDEKGGQDAGELVGLPTCGVRTTRSKQDILATDADLVVHAPSPHATYDEHDRDVIALLESGKNVLSIMGYWDPELLHGAEYAARFERACAKGGTTLYGGGLDPGYVAERLVPTVTSMSRRIDRLRLIESFDAANATEAMLRSCGFGLTKEEFARSAIFDMWTTFFTPTQQLMTRSIGRRPTRIDPFNDLRLADETLHLPNHTVEAGTVCANGMRWDMIVDDDMVLTLELRWRVGKIGDWGSFQGWRIEVDGDPCARLELTVAPTLERLECPDGLDTLPTVAGLVLNAIPEVIAAPPGILHAPVFAPYGSRV